ncbi:MAG: hypothetical protein CL943_03870 [Candidatus Diapherotrites archaeon]|uniref:Uncharacterized protein n=1 Tax=Candidatus Iainarchaeum sp. TaxID=3101447 RepID=A0A2D6M1V7_9ARCH|nr:hypothetical protein [Candidatus Diapherotrites archaeon]
MVNFHVGKVLKVIKPGKDVIASDASVQAVIEMWDGNELVLNIEPSLAPSTKIHDIVLVDYNPIKGVSPAIPRQEIIKVLKGKPGKELWEMFKKYLAAKTKKKQESADEPIPGITYSR